MWEPTRAHGQPARPDPRTSGQPGQAAPPHAQPAIAHLPDTRDTPASGEVLSERFAMPPADALIESMADVDAGVDGDAERDGAAAEADAREAIRGLGGAAAADAFTQRAQMRQLVREFLRAVPRSETETPLTLVRPDGNARVVTRAEFSAAIDRLRPRQRQIVRLTIEERWPRARVCAYLKNISIKTLERDQVEALDILAGL